MQSIYNFPQYYPLILKRKADVVRAETDTLEQIFGKHNRKVNSILELACGTMPHGRNLAGKGYTVTGVDRSEEMLAEAQRLAKQDGVDVTTSCQDVIDFDLPDQRFNAAIFMFETFPLISDLVDLESHFKAVHKHLSPGGLFIVDVDKVKVVESSGREEWGHSEIKVPEGKIRYWYEDLATDPSVGLCRMALNCEIKQNGEAKRTKDEWAVRAYSTFSLQLLARTMPGWKYKGSYNWQDGSPDLSSVRHWFTVFQKV